ncbi:MAG: CHASE domain-containing protein [Patescibacteria group bacterium]
MQKFKVKLPQLFSELHLPIVLILLIIGLSAYAARAVYIIGLERAHERLDRRISVETQHVSLTTEQLLHKYSVLLLSTRGLFAASTNVDRAEWATYVKSLDIKNEFPALSALEYIKRVSDEDLSSYISSVRTDVTVNPEGYPSFDTYPKIQDSEHFVVHYVEPFEANSYLFGYDLYTSDVRRSAINIARDTNSVVITAPVVVPTDDQDRKAFLMVLPIYNQKVDLSTLDARRENLVGVLVAVIRAADFYDQVFLTSSLTQTDALNVVDVTQAPLPLHSYFSNSYTGVKVLENIPLVSKFRINAATRTWLLEFRSSAQPTLTGLESFTPYLVFAVGMTFALIVGVVIYNTLRVTSKAKKLAAMLTQDLEKFKLAVENASDHIIITDPNGVILYANKRVTQITGYSQEEVIGKTPSLWGGQMPKEFFEHLWHTIKVEKNIFSGDIANKRKDGTAYIASIQISPVVDTRGEVKFFVGIERDVSHDRDVDRAKTEFLSLASHQLRTPLSALRWYAEMLESGDGGQLTAEQQEYAHTILVSSTRMIELVNALLDVSRMESGKIEVSATMVSPLELLTSLISELKPQLDEKQIIPQLNVAANVSNVYADEKLLRNVYLNLLSNAIKYTPQGGAISISFEENNGYLKSFVKDTRYGILKRL